MAFLCFFVVSLIEGYYNNAIDSIGFDGNGSFHQQRINEYIVNINRNGTPQQFTMDFFLGRSVEVRASHSKQITTGHK